MYLQQCDEYSGGKVEGSDTDGNLYSGIVCFMIVGLKSSESYVIRAVPKIHLSGPWLKEELKKTLHVVIGAGSSVSMVYFINLQISNGNFLKWFSEYGVSVIRWCNFYI